MDAETELANILSGEILAEINREVIRNIYIGATAGAVAGTTTSAGVFDLDTDSNGRWMVEKFKGLLYHIEREANAISIATRRGKGNFIITTNDCASALAMAGVLDYTPALQASVNTDTNVSTQVGTVNGMKVFVDPYYIHTNEHMLCVGYSSIVLTFRCKWFVLWVRIHSNRRLLSRLGMVLFLIHSQVLLQTLTIVRLKLQT